MLNWRLVTAVTRQAILNASDSTSRVVPADLFAGTPIVGLKLQGDLS